MSRSPTLFVSVCFTAAIALVACRASPTELRDQVLLTTEPSVAQGEPLQVTLENAFNRPVFFNLCTIEFTPTLDAVVCTQELHRLEPGKRANASRTIPLAADAGSYVARLDVEVDSASIELVSSAFMITEP